MVIEIGKIPEGVRIWESVLSFEEDLAKYFAINESVKISLETKRERSLISCFAKYKTEITCFCSRCLEEFQYELEGEVRFFVVHESRECADEGDFDFYRYRSGNEKIDFSQTVYDDIVTQIPMKPLCKDDCKGMD